MTTYALAAISVLMMGVAIGGFNSNVTTVTHTIQPFSPVLALLIDGLVDFGEKVLFIAGTEIPPAGSNVATDTFSWTSTTISGPHNLVLSGVAVTGAFTLADVVVDCGAGPITGTNPVATTGEYLVSVDATIDDSIVCTFTYGGAPRSIDWTHQIDSA